MAETHGHDDRDDDHDHHDEVQEDVVRTPLWLTLIGIGLLLAGSLGTYLFVYPGTMSPRTADGDAGSDAAGGGDGGGGDAAAAPGVAVPVVPEGAQH